MKARAIVEGEALVFKVDVLAPQTEGSTTWDRLRFQVPGGSGFTLWINRQTGLLDRVEGRTTKKLSDYRPVNGVMLPFEEKKPAGSEMLTVVYTRRTLRQHLDAAAFAIPFRKDYQMPPSGEVSVPAEGGLIFQATIDGKGPFKGVFDTGSVNILSANLARKLGLKVDAQGLEFGTSSPANVQAHKTHVDALQIGDLLVRDQTFYVIDLPDENGAPPFLVGYESLRRLAVKNGGAPKLRPPVCAAGQIAVVDVVRTARIGELNVSVRILMPTLHRAVAICLLYVEIPDLSLGHIGAAMQVLNVAQASSLLGDGCGAVRVALFIELPGASTAGLIKMLENGLSRRLPLFGKCTAAKETKQRGGEDKTHKKEVKLATIASMASQHRRRPSLRTSGYYLRKISPKQVWLLQWYPLRVSDCCGAEECKSIGLERKLCGVKRRPSDLNLAVQNRRGSLPASS